MRIKVEQTVPPSTPKEYLKGRTVYAVVVGDIHLRPTAPLARHPDRWYDRMYDYMWSIKLVQEKYNVPVICTGDLFHKWNNSPPELVNFAMRLIHGKWYAIPGQHDLPYHRHAELGKSPFYTLMMGERIVRLTQPILANENLALYPFEWNRELKPRTDFNKEKNFNGLHVAVIHKYIWTEGCSYHGAPKSNSVAALSKKLKGFDTAVFGDNHTGFWCEPRKKDEPFIWNGGALYRAKTDELDYKPRLGLLLDNGTVVPAFMDLGNDRWVDGIDSDSTKDDKLDTFELIQALEKMNVDEVGEFDFRENLDKILNAGNIHPETQDLVRTIMERVHVDSRQLRGG